MSTTTNWPTPEQRAAMRLRLAELEREHHKIKADIKAQLAREAAQEPIRLPDPPIVRARNAITRKPLPRTLIDLTWWGALIAGSGWAAHATGLLP